jgi:hypothetical protein
MNQRNKLMKKVEEGKDEKGMRRRRTQEKARRLQSRSNISAQQISHKIRRSQ